MNFLIMQFSSLQFKYSPQHPVVNTVCSVCKFYTQKGYKCNLNFVYSESPDL